MKSTRRRSAPTLRKTATRSRTAAVAGDLSASVSPDQRERIIRRLSESYAHDHLDDVEFERRVSEAHRVSTHSALIALVADLPAEEEDHSASSRFPSTVATNRDTVRASESIFAILGGSERRGVWRPARRSRVLAIMGGVDLDYRKALFPHGVTEVTVFCVMGGVDVIVPPGVNVEVSGLPILGGFSNRAGSGTPGGPTLRVSGVAVMGGVDIKEKKPKK
ncbi:MAG: DUF1707 and DUF2154 domain-containing protein [Spirochaetaceae bacterium]|nr:MAG: DUF1707 and DUF2154 domain-containing protein [Spirochaetaceae bacterium]